MKYEQDPILESALEEALAGKSPPDLTQQTLARTRQPAKITPLQPTPRPHWRAWTSGLAAAAVLVLAFGIFAWNGEEAVTFNGVAQVEQFDQSPSLPSAMPDESRKNSEDARLAEFEFTSKHVPRMGGEQQNEEAKALFTGDAPRGYVPANAPEPVPSPPSPLEKLRDSAGGPSGDPSFADELDKPDGTIAKGHGFNPFVDASEERLSTFAMEHDGGSYTLARGYLNDGTLPPAAAIRPEEFINYFDYRYAKPAREPFAVTMDAAPSPYGGGTHLLRVGVQAREIPADQRKPAVLTLVVDVSGSMRGEHRIGLVKRALELLVNELNEGDRVALIKFGSQAELVLGHTEAWRKDEILHAIRGLQAGGSTNAEQGLRIAYDLAREQYRDGHTNRIVLCSDGVANTGISDVESLISTIVDERRRGIQLSSLGFGMSNYNDHLLEQLGNKGDGSYAYIDSIEEAQRVFTGNLTGAFEVVGRDVKIQLDFNPAVVESWRLIGYVNRHVANEDFRNDAVSGGEIRSGHAATALYAIKLRENAAGHIAQATLRYKTDELAAPEETSFALASEAAGSSWDEAPAALRLAGNVAQFAEVLAESPYVGDAGLLPVIEDLQVIAADWDDERVVELHKLVKQAHELKSSE